MSLDISLVYIYVNMLIIVAFDNDLFLDFHFILYDILCFTCI